MLLGATTCIWLVGALCHEVELLRLARKFVRPGWALIHKCGGSKEVTVEVWICMGQTRPQGPAWGVAPPTLVDNHLRFSPKSPTFRLLHRLSAEFGIL